MLKEFYNFRLDVFFLLVLFGVVAMGALSLYLKTKDVLCGNRIRAGALTKRE